MIELKDLSYVRFGTSSLKDAESFATKCLGLQVGEQSGKAVYLRSDDRAHTLCYFEGDPAEQTVGFEVEDEGKLNAAAATLDQLGHPVHSGTPSECALRKVKAFIGFKDPTGNHIELVVRPERSGKRYFASRDAGITGFSHVGLFTTDPVRDERFWTEVCNARVSDRIGDIALMRSTPYIIRLRLRRDAGRAYTTSTIRSRATTTCCAPTITCRASASPSYSARVVIRHQARDFSTSEVPTEWCSSIPSA
jgi:catechol 2,3-dioxygenase-like lactoylglutathione lyase family enzyme